MDDHGFEAPAWLLGGEVERLGSCSRLEYLERYRGRSPFVLEGGARGTAAFERWDPEHVMAVAGRAPLHLLVGVYEPEARPEGYRRAREVETTLGEVVAALLAGEADQGYLFNDPSVVLRTNPGRAEFKVGWGDASNPGLEVLGKELELPELVREEDLIHAFLLLGGPHHAAPLHYDLGGEAKLLIQVRGRKRVVLFPPSDAGLLAFPGWFEASGPYQSPHVSRIDLHRPDLARFPEVRRARGLVTTLEPGDVLYWPPFWPHYVTNLDPFTLAVSVAHEELGASCMLMREAIGMTARMFRDLTAREGEVGLEEGLRRLERLVLSDEYRNMRTFYGWHGKVWGNDD